MKKFLCMLLTVALLITAIVPVMAIDASDDEAISLSALFGEYMPEDPWQRILIWKTFKAYMLDGNNGINTVIKALKGEITLPDTAATEVILWLAGTVTVVLPVSVPQTVQ